MGKIPKQRLCISFVPCCTLTQHRPLHVVNVLLSFTAVPADLSLKGIQISCCTRSYLQQIIRHTLVLPLNNSLIRIFEYDNKDVLSASIIHSKVTSCCSPCFWFSQLAVWSDLGKNSLRTVHGPRKHFSSKTCWRTTSTRIGSDVKHAVSSFPGKESGSYCQLCSQKLCIFIFS